VCLPLKHASDRQKQPGSAAAAAAANAATGNGKCQVRLCMQGFHWTIDYHA